MVTWSKQIRKRYPALSGGFHENGAAHGADTPRAGSRAVPMSKSDANTLEGIAAETPPTCRNDSAHCPVDNAAVADDRLPCFACWLELSRADERPADAL